MSAFTENSRRFCVRFSTTSGAGWAPSTTT
jgi:hypothetical protein